MKTEKGIPEVTGKLTERFHLHHPAISKNLTKPEYSAETSFSSSTQQMQN